MSNGLFSKGLGDSAGRIHCAQCGKPIAIGSRFCAACGSPAPQKVCLACTTINAPQAKFCVKCGHGLDVQPAAAKPAIPPAGVTTPPALATEERRPVDMSGGPSALARPAPAVKPSEVLGVSRPSVVERESPSTAAVPEPAQRSDSPPQTAPQPVPDSVLARSAISPVVDEGGVLRRSSATTVARTPPPTQATPPARNRKPLLLGVGALVTVLLIGAAGYGYWTGVIGDRPGSIAREATESLRAAGFDNVTVAMGKDWVARVTGTVVGQEQRSAIDKRLAGHSDIRSADLESLRILPSSDDIKSGVEKALLDNGLTSFGVVVSPNGDVALTGRALTERDIAVAGEAASNVAGVSAVDNRILAPLGVLERNINQALRAAGFADVQAHVRNTDDVRLTGILREGQEPAAVIAKVVETAAAYQEAVSPSAVSDEMVIEVPTAPESGLDAEVARGPRSSDPAVPSEPGASDARPGGTRESSETPVEPDGVKGMAPVVGSWAGDVKIIGWTGRRCGVVLKLNAASIGEVAGTLETQQLQKPYMSVPLVLTDVSEKQFTLNWKPPIRCLRQGGECGECVLDQVRISPLDDGTASVVAMSRKSRFEGLLKRQ